MRRGDDPGIFGQTPVGRRLRFKCVHRNAGDPSLLERTENRLLIEQRAPGGIDKIDALLHGGDGLWGQGGTA